MTKTQVLIHSAESDAVVKHIYELGLIQAIEVVEQGDEPRLQKDNEGIAERIAELDGKLRDVSLSLEILKGYDDSGREIIENFVTLKQRISRRELLDVQAHFDFLAVSRNIRELNERLKQLEGQKARLQDDAELLNTLDAIPFPLSGLRSTRWVKSVVGRVRKESQEALAEEFAAHEKDIFWEKLAEKGQFFYLFVLYYAPSTAIPQTLERYGVDPVNLTRFSNSVPEELRRLDEEMAALTTQRDGVKKALTDLVQHTTDFRIIEEYLFNEIERCKELQNFAETRKVYFVEGWMKQRDKPRLERELQRFHECTDIFYEDPARDDDTVPVILENSPRIQPFEIITRMFGMPKYHEPDPTPMLAPFFFLFFGLCLTDAGYGILLSLFMMWLMKRYVLDSGTVQLARLLFYGGISTVFAGALTGGWFGDIFDALPASLGFITQVKNRLILINPMEEPIAFLILALILGYIQVGYGIFLKMRNRIKQGELADALMDEGIWLIFINSLFVGMVLSVLGVGTSPIGQSLIVTLQGFAVLSGLARIWLHDRENPRVVVRVFAGLYSLYDIVGVFSDVLSYSRLLALGLATGVIAMIVDMLALMTSDIPWVGLLLGVVIFSFGHLFNLVINTLGAFIHSGRLQFIEFFSKFFEAGGKKYKPFRFQSKYFEIMD